MVTGRRTQTRERKSIGNRKNGPRNKERVRSVQRDQRGLFRGEEESSKGLQSRQRKRRKCQEAGQRKRERKKGRASLTGTYTKKTTGQETTLRKDGKTWDRKQDRGMVRGNKGQGAGQR